MEGIQGVVSHSVTMRIAFDLDDTLIPGEYRFPLEPRPRGLLSWWFTTEPLRLGTVEMFNVLRQRGHEVWIYTTSNRGPFATRAMFWCYGTDVRKVINDDVHLSVVPKLGPAYEACIKYPPAFGIDVLIDNSNNVLQESKKFDYDVLHVSPHDTDWVATILDALGID